MPHYNEGMTVADLKAVLDGGDMQDDDYVFVNSEYGKTSIYSIRRSVPVALGGEEGEEMPVESPYIILNG